jgi:hypothetical protein
LGERNSGPQLHQVHILIKAFWSELFVAKELQASFVIPSVSISFILEIKISVSGFVQASPPDSICLTVPIVLTTDWGPGQRARSFAPAPAYGERPEELEQIVGGGRDSIDQTRYSLDGVNHLGFV